MSVRLLALPLVVLVTLALIGASLFTGEYDITLSSLISRPDHQEMFFISRVPRTLALLFAATAMSVSGVLMQSITQNRFVEPTTAGTSHWAGLGVLCGLIAVPGAPPLVRMLIAVVFAFIGTMLFMLALRRIRVRSGITVPLVGIMLGAVVGAATTFIAGSTNLLQSISAWQSGGFSGVVRGFYEPLWACVVVAVLAVVLAHRFTLAGLGSEVSTGLGLNYRRTALLGVLMVALSTGVTSVVVGFIPFLGLIVPNLVSLLVGDHLRRSLPWVIVLGCALLLACDLVGRRIIAPMEIPASVILGVVGATGFILLLLHQRRRVHD